MGQNFLIDPRLARQMSPGGPKRQWDLARLTGINQTKISLIENAYVTPSENEKKKIAQALGFDVKDIVWPDDGFEEGEIKSAEVV